MTSPAPASASRPAAAEVKGSDLVVSQLLRHGVRDFFHIIGGPITPVIVGSIAAGIRGIGVRDERAGAYAAIAYSRVARRPGVLMACSGPGTIGAVPGVAHAYADGAPLVVLGGSASTWKRTTGLFQETDQVGVMRPITKWAHQVAHSDEIPEMVTRALQVAITCPPGPVYIDLPSDVLVGNADKDGLDHPVAVPRSSARAAADPAAISAAVDLIERACKPVIIAGSGVLWSGAESELRAFIEAANIPFFTTAMAAGIVPEDHPLSFPAARSTAFREADLLIVAGTRDNYVLNYLQPPVMRADSMVIELNANPGDLSHNRPADVAILADAKLGLAQLTGELARRGSGLNFADWTDELRVANMRARARDDASAASDAGIHPYRLAATVRKLTPRNALLVLDGRETLAFGRRAMAAYVPAGFLNPGTYGTMGVGVPFAIGAKLAAPSLPVVALLGDGAFGYHAMEIETAMRHEIGFVCVIANNGGWTGARGRPGHALSYSDYHTLGQVFGCWGHYVRDEVELELTIREALAYAQSAGKPAIINVLTASARANSRPRDFRITGAHNEYAET